MITELRIGNFKAFGVTQRVPIKPLTLIFGANSCGKSSLIHGLLLLRHLWQKGNPDAYQLQKLAEAVDLGGFRQYVFNHDQGRKVELEVQLAPTADWEAPLHQVAAGMPLNVRLRVGLDIAMEGVTAPTVESVEIDRGKSNLAILVGKSPGVLTWEKALPLICALQPQWEALVRLLKQPDNEKATQPASPGSGAGEVAIAAAPSVERFLIERLNAVGALAGRKLLEPQGSRLAREMRDLLGSDDAFEWLSAYFTEHDKFSLDVDGFLEAIGDEFNEPLIYLGPLRFYPPRHLMSATENDPAWTSGGGWAWWRIFSDEPVRGRVNDALERMNVRYSVRLREWSDPANPPDRLAELVIQDESGRLLSARDIGVGVSQVVPVVASAVASSKAIIAVEQPEIHLHPALQAELGDVFIESALGERKNTFLLETHSEHLILRILRRIRETTAGVDAGLPAIRPENVAVLYVKPTENGSVVTELPVTPDGDFSEPWPDGFFPERAKELF